MVGGHKKDLFMVKWRWEVGWGDSLGNGKKEADTQTWRWGLCVFGFKWAGEISEANKVLLWI